MKKIITLIAIGLMSMTGFSQTTTNTTTTTDSSPEPKSLRRVNKDEFKTYLNAHKNVQLIDVRTPNEFKGGNIEGSVNINFNSPDFVDMINKLDKNKTVLIYCRSGGRSARALKIFEANGFVSVLELGGGFMKW